VEIALPKKAILLIFLGFALLLLGALTSFALFQVPVPMSQQWVKDKLRDRHFHYDIEFDRTRIRWQPGANAVDLHFEDAVISEPYGDAVAAIPEVVLSVDDGVFLSDAPVLKSVTFSGPKIRVVKSLGGALRIDIGPSEDGLSGSLVMDLLTDIAAARSPPVAGGESPQLKLADARLFLADLATGVRMRLNAVNATVRSAPAGVVAQTDFMIDAAGEQIFAALDILFSTASQSFSLDGRFENVTPAVLSDRFPNIDFLKPLELPVDGTLSVRFDRVLNLEQADISFKGATGSLELADHSGRNLSVRALHGRLFVDDYGKVFRIEDFRLKMPDRALEGYLSGLSTRAGLKLVGELTLSNGAWSDVAPLWFAPLAPLIGPTGDPGESTPGKQVLVFAVLIARHTGRLSGSGSLRLERHPGATDGTPAGGDASAKVVKLSIGGSRRAPEIRFLVGDE